MEISTMFSRYLSAVRTHVSQRFLQLPNQRRTHSGHAPAARTRLRALPRLEGLDDRCLLAGISSITEFPLSSPSGNLLAITVGPDRNLWFTDGGGNSIGVINPTTHAISLFPAPTASAHLAGITSGPDGNLWFTERSADQIGMINPTTHAIREFALPAGFTYPTGIAVGPDGNVWFTASTSHAVGKINPTTDVITIYSYTNIATQLGLTWSLAITEGSNGNLWFTTNPSAGNHPYIGEINPSTGAVSSVAEPCDAAGLSPEAIISGPDGNLWMTSGVNVIGMINPTTGASSQFTIPTTNASSYAVAAGPDGNLWFTVINTGHIDSINPTTDAITTYAVPYTGSTTGGITAGPDGNLWFTDLGTNSIGVATLATSQLVVTQQPPSSVTAGSGFGLTVTAEDSSGNPITSFNGTVTVALANNPGGATLGGTLTATASNGVATFSGITLTKAASGYTLVVTSSGIGEGVTSAMTVTPAVATQLVISQQPPATVKVSTAFGIEALIEDQFGNVVTTANNTVTVALGNNPSKATLGGTLTVTASQGVVTFSGLTVNQIGSGFTLVVSSTGLGQAVTDPFSVTKKG
jgi:virginiamycin B lyase